MRRVTLPSTLKAWYTQAITNGRGRTLYVISGKPTDEVDIDLPGFWYDQRGHCTCVSQSVVEDVRIDPETSSGLPGQECYVNSASPEIEDARLLPNGISYHSKFAGYSTDDELIWGSTDVKHGIASQVLNYTKTAYKVKFLKWISGRYTVQYTTYYQYRYQYQVPCAKDERADALDPGSVIAFLQSCQFTERSTGLGWASYLTLHYKTPSPYLGKFIFEYNEGDWVPPSGSRNARPQRCTDLMGAALKKAVDQFPKFADNNVANISEMTSLVIDLLKGNAPGILDSLSKLGKSKRATGKFLKDAWLGYRYSYCTTKSDTQQALDALARRQITYMKPLRFDGNASGPLIFRGTGDVHCHVGFEVVQQTRDLLRSIRHGLYNAGLEINAYTLWDMVPFSFVVDWFTGWGDDLEAKVVGDHYSDYVFSNMCWSLKYEYDDSTHNHYKCYSRWYEVTTPTYNTQYNRVSGRTWLKRAADGIALVYH